MAREFDKPYIAFRQPKSALRGAIELIGKGERVAPPRALVQFVSDSTDVPVERSARTSRIGGCPKRRLYSRLNWLTLS